MRSSGYRRNLAHSCKFDALCPPPSPPSCPCSTPVHLAWGRTSTHPAHLPPPAATLWPCGWPRSLSSLAPTPPPPATSTRYVQLLVLLPLPLGPASAAGGGCGSKDCAGMHCAFWPAPTAPAPTSRALATANCLFLPAGCLEGDDPGRLRAGSLRKRRHRHLPVLPRRQCPGPQLCRKCLNLRQLPTDELS